VDERAERDALEAVGVVAKAARRMYEELCAQKFSGPEALRLTAAWLSKRYE